MNQFEFNEQPFNYGIPFPADSITDAIIFNGYGLQNSNIISSYKTDYNMPGIDLNTSSNPIIDGGIVLNRKYPENIISIEGVLKASTASALLTLMDNFKLKTSALEDFLDILQDDGVYRRIKATCISNDLFDKKHYDITRCPFKIQFKSVEPFFYNRTEEANTLSNISVDSNIDISYLGTAPSFPKQYFIFNVATSVTSIIITLGSFAMTISETISSGDVLVIDGEEKTVKLNGVEIDYDGTFFELTNGSNVVNLNLNGTFDFDYTYIYKKNWL